MPLRNGPARKLSSSPPGAFTSSCQARHLPPFIEQYDKLKAKGVDIVTCIGYNDGWTMCAWGKVNGISNDDIVGYQCVSCRVSTTLTFGGSYS
ncbi:hypothetical protein BDV96DRAFT_591331 [Lophiotrema nucula]|uniref:Redoxin domain-containing protein n=1 Tax=Lophiotrema nucula TaxID=690887 RepID=A0A6A5YGG4_9PLEO|nr:hypothetical protein BDV96DRAFT_591331 [Lophiotrema nucula]